MATNDETLRIKIETNATTAQKELRLATRELENLYAIGEKGVKLENAEKAFRDLYNSVSLGKSKIKEIKSEIDNVNKSFKDLTKEEDDLNKKTFSLSQAISVMLGNMASNIISNFANNMQNLVKDISKAGIELDALNNTMMAATGGWKQGQNEMNWLIGMSNRLGLSFGDVSDSYAKFMTSFTRSGGTISQSRQIFEDLSAAMVSLHLPAERMQGVFVALEQMANKGTVQSEELKRQLGNALPGAFELAAESMGVLPAKLMDLMKAGKVFSKDFLPAFAATVKGALGQSIDIASMQFNAAINRLASATDLLKMNLGQMLNDALLPLVNGLVKVTQAVANMAKYLNENRGVVIAFTATLAELGVVMVGLKWNAITTAVATLAGTIKTALVGALKVLQGELAVINVETAGLPILIGTLVVGITALTSAVSDANRQAADISGYIGLEGQLTNLVKDIETIDTKTQEGRESLKQYQEQFPTLMQYLQETGKSFRDLTNDEINHIVVLGQHDMAQKALNERTQEMAKWQSYLSAGCVVWWDNMKAAGHSLASAIGDAFNYIINAAKKMAETIMKLMSAIVKSIADMIHKFTGAGMQIGQFAQKVGNAVGGLAGAQMSTFGKAIEMANKPLNTFTGDLSASISNIKDFGSIAKYSIDKTNGAIVGMAKNLPQVQAVLNVNKQILNQMEETANTNLTKKLELINAGAKNATKSLIQAQIAAVGLEDATGGDGKKGKGKSGGSKKPPKTPTVLTPYEQLGKDISAKEKELQNAIYGKRPQEEIQRLANEYLNLKQAQKSVKDEMDKLAGTVKTKSAYKQLQEDLKNTRDLYKSMVLESENYTKKQIEDTRKELGYLEAKNAYYNQLQKHESVMQITNKAAKQLGDTLVDSIFKPLGEGESLWTRFKDAGIDALKAIAQQMSKQFLQDMVTGFSGGFRLIGKTDSGSSFGERILGGLKGAGALFQGKSLDSILGGETEGGGSGLSVLNQDASVLSETLMSQTRPAIEGAMSGLGGLSENALSSASSLVGVMNPALQTAQSIASMAISAPIAATSIGSLGTVMTTASSTFMSAAPSLMAMASAMQTLATSASQAAVSMAALAVSTAAESVAKIPFVGGFLAPVAALATGAAIAGGTLLTGAGIGASAMLAGGGQMLGGAMSKIGTGGKIIPHAKGGIVSSPTMFPMQGGNVGLAGEAGTEIIAPAKRMSNGELGIGAVQPQVTVNNYTNANVEVIRRPNNEMEIKIAELNAMLSSSRSNKGMSAAQSRMQQKGRQIG